MTLDDLRAFESLLRTKYPRLRIAFKDESASQKALGFLLYPFNAAFMTRYTSTFAPVVYFPSKEAYEGNPRASVTILAHEYIHLLDTAKSPFWFRFSYLFPQVLAPFAFLAYGGFARGHSWPLAVLLGWVLLSTLIARVSMAAFFVASAVGLLVVGFLAVWYSGWAAAFLGLGLVLLAPWPAPGRVRLEQRGYTMTLAIYCWTYGYVPQILQDAVGRMFTGPSYLFMSWSKAATADFVRRTVDQATDGALLKDESFAMVYEFLRSRDLVR